MSELLLEALPAECHPLLADKLPGKVEKVVILRKKKQHTVYRLYSKEQSFVLKCFQTPSVAKEIQIYALLQKYGVPTLPCHGMTNNAILLEDLEHSAYWRCADNGDMKLSTTGNAVAHWYQQLHAAGFDVLGSAEEKLDYLQPWVDIIERDALKKVGDALDVADCSSWKLTLSNFEALIEKYRLFHQTFNYNDFAAENLALSITHYARMQAIVYDYDQFSIGTVYSDWRNVIYSLQDEAQDAFIAAYGQVNESERLLDDVLSILQGLIIAVDRDRFPKWALPLQSAIVNGELERKIQAALGIS